MFPRPVRNDGTDEVDAFLVFQLFDMFLILVHLSLPSKDATYTDDDDIRGACLIWLVM